MSEQGDRREVSLRHVDNLELLGVGHRQTYEGFVDPLRFTQGEVSGSDPVLLLSEVYAKGSTPDLHTWEGRWQGFPTRDAAKAYLEQVSAKPVPDGCSRVLHLYDNPLLVDPGELRGVRSGRNSSPSYTWLPPVREQVADTLGVGLPEIAYGRAGPAILQAMAAEITDVASLTFWVRHHALFPEDFEKKFGQVGRKLLDVSARDAAFGSDEPEFRERLGYDQKQAALLRLADTNKIDELTDDRLQELTDAIVEPWRSGGELLLDLLNWQVRSMVQSGWQYAESKRAGFDQTVHRRSQAAVEAAGRATVERIEGWQQRDPIQRRGQRPPVQLHAALRERNRFDAEAVRQTEIDKIVSEVDRSDKLVSHDAFPLFGAAEQWGQALRTFMEWGQARSWLSSAYDTGLYDPYVGVTGSTDSAPRGSAVDPEWLDIDP